MTPSDCNEQEIVRNNVQQDFDSVEVSYLQDDKTFDPDDIETATMLKYIRLRNRYSEELSTVKRQMSSMMSSLESKISNLDYLYRDITIGYTKKALQNRKERSIKTPFGTVGFRKQQQRLQLLNEQRVIELSENGALPEDCRKVSVTVNKRALQKHYEATGEIPFGCEIVPEHDKFYVK